MKFQISEKKNELSFERLHGEIREEIRFYANESVATLQNFFGDKSGPAYEIRKEQAEDLVGFRVYWQAETQHFVTIEILDDLEISSVYLGDREISLVQMDDFCGLRSSCLTTINEDLFDCFAKFEDRSGDLWLLIFNSNNELQSEIKLR